MNKKKKRVRGGRQLRKVNGADNCGSDFYFRIHSPSFALLNSPPNARAVLRAHHLPVVVVGIESDGLKKGKKVNKIWK